MAPSDFGSQLLGKVLAPGTVLYFKEASHEVTSPPHYFVIINNPKSDSLLLLVCATSQETTILRRTAYLPPETVVEVSPSEYGEFSAKKSYFNCNNITEKTISQLEVLLGQKKLSYKAPIPEAILARLIAGVLASPLVRRELKKILT